MKAQRKILSVCAMACLLIAGEIALAQERNRLIEPVSDDQEFGADAEAEEEEDAFFAKAPVKRITAKVATDRLCRTLATELELIPGTTVKFTQGPGKPEEVVVTFVASWPKPLASEIPAGSQAAGAFIFLFVDDDRIDPVSLDGGVLVHEGTASSVSNGTHGFTFVTEPVAPGEHVVEIFFLDNVLGPFGDPNGTICVDDRSTVVQHK